MGTKITGIEEMKVEMADWDWGDTQNHTTALCRMGAETLLEQIEEDAGYTIVYGGSDGPLMAKINLIGDYFWIKVNLTDSVLNDAMDCPIEDRLGLSAALRKLANQLDAIPHRKALSSIPD